MGLQMRLDAAIRRRRSALVIISILLFLTPPIWCRVYFTINPQTPPMGLADIKITADTYVSTTNDFDHSDESLIWISNTSDGEELTSEIAFLQFDVVIPPAGSYLANLTLRIQTAEVVSGGIIRFHKCNQRELGSNVTRETAPFYNSTFFTEVTIYQNGSRTISLYVNGGYKEWPRSGPQLLAITANRGTSIVIHSSEALPSLRSSLTLYTPFGLGLMIDPSEQPWICYAHPLAWIPVLIAITLLGATSRRSIWFRNDGAEGEI